MIFPDRKRVGGIYSRTFKFKLRNALGLIRDFGPLKFLGVMMPWLMRRRYIFCAQPLQTQDFVPASDLSFRLELARERDLPLLMKARPGYYTPAVLERRLREGHLCFLGWTGERLIHIRWFFVRSLYLPYLKKTLLLSPGEIYEDEVFTHPEFRCRGVYSLASYHVRRLLQEMGYNRLTCAFASWNQIPLRVSEKLGLRKVGEGGYWNFLAAQKFFWKGSVRDHGNGQISIKPSLETAKSAFQSFWDWTGHFLPPFYEAPSTRYYFECERSLFEAHLGVLSGKTVLKTDLWDEAKNSRILNWAAGQGAAVFGLDISSEILRQAKDSFGRQRLKLAGIISDLREIGFKDNSFDIVYSMGTVEHFPEYEQAIRECFRVLRPGGRAIIGVPNRFDLFLRPLLVAILNGLRLYAYGEERSFGMRRLEQMLGETGFRVIGRTGILFIPGWLRMIELFLYVRWPWTRFLTAPLVAPFAFLYRTFPLLRRQGYLIACVVEKPKNKVSRER